MADALSRKTFETNHTTELNAFSMVQTSWLEQIRGNWENDEDVQVLIIKLIIGSTDVEGYTYTNDTLRY